MYILIKNSFSFLTNTIRIVGSISFTYLIKESSVLNSGTTSTPTLIQYSTYMELNTKVDHPSMISYLYQTLKTYNIGIIDQN